MTGIKTEDSSVKNINNFVFFHNLAGVTGKDYKNTKDFYASRSELRDRQVQSTDASHSKVRLDAKATTKVSQSKACKA
jgi:hypothetical protein